YIIILIALIPLLLSIIHYYYKSNIYKHSYTQDDIKLKIYEINDRQPTYKLVTYEGYEFPLKRNRAQTILINQLNLYEKCQKYPNTTIFDIGASLGNYLYRF
ncbi:unnamed protein product, partial [Rotaria sp. Silwood2]